MSEDKYDGLMRRLNEISYEMLTSKEDFIQTEAFVYRCPFGHSPENPITLSTMNNTFRKRVDKGEPYCVKCRKMSLSASELNKALENVVSSVKPSKSKKDNEKKDSKELENEDSDKSTSESFLSDIKNIVKSETSLNDVFEKCCKRIKEKYSLSFSKLSEKKEFKYTSLFSFQQKDLFDEVDADILSLGRKIPKAIITILKKLKKDSFYSKILMEFLASEYSSPFSHKMIKFFFERNKVKKGENIFMLFDYQENILDKIYEETKNDIFCGLSDCLPILEYKYKNEVCVWYPDFYIAKENRMIDVYSREVYNEFSERIQRKIEDNKELCNIEVWIVNEDKSVEVVKNY